MYAVIATGGKQYRVSPGEVVKVEKIAGEPGKEVVFDQVLMVSGDQTLIGTPLVEGAEVIGEVIKQAKGQKVIIYKYKPKKHSRKKIGHRQSFTEVRIKEIKLANQKSLSSEASGE